QDKLASAVEFDYQGENDEGAGSASLRRAVVAEAIADLDRFQVGDVVDYRSAMRASSFAVLGLALIILVAMSAPAGSGIALARLSNPFSDISWPRHNQLAFQNPPARLASGQLFEIELIDQNNHLPESVNIQYHFEGESDRIDVPMLYIDGVMVAQRENVRRPFRYRATGGDGATPWHNLDIVEAPRVQNLEVQLQPPAYTGWPKTDSIGPIVGIEGTQIHLAGNVNKAISSAELITDSGKSIPASLSPDGLEFKIPAEGSAPWTIERTGSYWIHLIDFEEIEGGDADKWQVRVLADEPPTVNLEEPLPELHVTPQATVQCRVFAKDGLAIRDVSLKYTRSDQSDAGEQSIDFPKGPDQVAPMTVEQQTASLAKGDRQVHQYELDLAALKLAPGTQLTLIGSAHDYQPAEGRSEPAQRIYIVTKNEIVDRLGRRQSSILSDLVRAVQQEKNARRRITELEIQLDEVGRFQEKDIHQLQTLELAQREVSRTLAGKEDGILSRIEALLGELKSNKVNTPETVRQLESLKNLLRQLNANHLGPIQQDLTVTRKNLQANFTERLDPTENDRSLKKELEPLSEIQQQRNEQAHEALISAAGHQDEVIRQLTEALEPLQRWNKYRKFVRDLVQLAGDLKARQGEMEQIGKATLGRAPSKLTPQQRADLKKIAERISESARDFDKTVEGMETAGTSIQQSDPLAAASVADAAHHAREKSISAQIRSTAQNVQQNQLGQALGKQKTIAKNIEEMIDILSNR
ncbi:MAG: hypothetical protein N2C12_05000, partial [Planctomycetales bacterium]